MRRYKEFRTLSAGDLRMLCIAHEWFTKGNIQEYEEMLQYAEAKENIKTEDLAKIASWIREHSTSDSLSGYSDTEIMEALILKTVTRVELD